MNSRLPMARVVTGPLLREKSMTNKGVVGNDNFPSRLKGPSQCQTDQSAFVTNSLNLLVALLAGSLSAAPVFPHAQGHSLIGSIDVAQED